MPRGAKNKQACRKRRWTNNMLPHETMTESYIYKNYYAPHATHGILGNFSSFAHISDNGIEWDNHDLIANKQAQAITIHGSSIHNKAIKDTFLFIHELCQFEYLKFLSIPIDFLSLIQWEHEETRLEHLRMNNPVNGDLWGLFKEKKLPQFPSNIFQKLVTLELPCPAKDWRGFDIKNFPILKWFATELEEYDRSGLSLKSIAKNPSITGYGLFDPKGHDILSHIPVNIESLGIWRATSKKFNFCKIDDFKNLKYLQLTGSPTVFDINWIASLPNLEELELRSFQGIKGAELLFGMNNLKYLKIDFTHDKSYMNPQEKIMLYNKIQYCSLD